MIVSSRAGYQPEDILRRCRVHDLREHEPGKRDEHGPEHFPELVVPAEHVKDCSPATQSGSRSLAKCQPDCPDNCRNFIPLNPATFLQLAEEFLITICTAASLSQKTFPRIISTVTSVPSFLISRTLSRFIRAPSAA